MRSESTMPVHELEALLIRSGVIDERPPALEPEPPNAWERLRGVAPVMLAAGLAGLLALAWRALEWAVTWQAAVDAMAGCAI